MQSISCLRLSFKFLNQNPEPLLHEYTKSSTFSQQVITKHNGIGLLLLEVSAKCKEIVVCIVLTGY